MKMGFLKRVIGTIFTIIVVLIVAVAVLVHLFGDRALKAGVEVGATNALNVDVTVDDVSLSILGGRLSLENLVVSNPPGYEHPNLLELGKGDVAVNIRSLMSDTVNIESIKFDGITLVIEQKDLIRTNNLQEILKSLPSGDDEAEPAQETEPVDDGEKPSKKLVIDELDVSNVMVKVKLLPLPGRADTVTLNLEPIRMTDVGKDGPVDIAILTGKILTAIAAGIAHEGADLLPSEIIGPMKSVLTESGEVIMEGSKEMLDKSKDIGKDLLEGTKDIGKGVGDAFKGLFEKKEQ